MFDYSEMELFDLLNTKQQFEEDSKWKRDTPCLSDPQNEIQLLYDFVYEAATSIMDLGCGSQVLRKMLKSHQKYIPVDYKPRSDDTVLCDFNKGEFPRHGADACLICGCLEYVVDWRAFLKKVSGSCNQIVLSYRTTESCDIRHVMWVNNVSEADLTRYISDLGFELVEYKDCSQSRLFSFVKQ